MHIDPMSSNESTWELIEEGWTKPIKTIVDGTTHPKERSKYIVEEKDVGNGNSQALNIIFSGVDLDQLKFISMCESTKEAWTILLS